MRAGCNAVGYAGRAAATPTRFSYVQHDNRNYRFGAESGSGADTGLKSSTEVV